MAVVGAAGVTAGVASPEWRVGRPRRAAVAAYSGAKFARASPLIFPKSGIYSVFQHLMRGFEMAKFGLERVSAMREGAADAAALRGAAGVAGVEVNRVLKNTYILLSLTLLFSALMAGLAMALDVRPLGLVVTLLGWFGLLFLTAKFRNSPLGIALVFAFTGFMGFTLGPIVDLYVSALANGGQVVLTALGGTGIIFVGLSAYALTSRKDFSFIGGMLFVGIMVAFVAGIAAAIFAMPALSLAVAAMFVLLMSGLILFQTSQIIHGGETNYIMATITLYITIYNLFISLLQIFGLFGDD